MPKASRNTAYGLLFMTRLRFIIFVSVLCHASWGIGQILSREAKVFDPGSCRIETVNDATPEIQKEEESPEEKETKVSRELKRPLSNRSLAIYPKHFRDEDEYVPIIPKKAITFFWDPEVLALCEAIEKEDLEAIQKLSREEGVDIDTKGHGGVTPLMWAYHIRKKRSFKHLMVLGANPNARGFSDEESPFLPHIGHGGSVMHAAACDPDEEYLEYALNFWGRADLPLNSVEDRNFTPLRLAIGSHRRINVYLMLKEGVDPSKVKGLEEPAFSNSSYDVVLMLLKKNVISVKNQEGEKYIYKLVKSHAIYDRLRKVKESSEEDEPSPANNEDYDAYWELVALLKEQEIDIEAMAKNLVPDAKLPYEIQKYMRDEPYMFDPNRYIEIANYYTEANTPPAPRPVRRERAWKNADDKFLMAGAYISSDEESVTIETFDGASITIKLSDLSEGDRKYAERRRKQELQSEVEKNER